MGAFVVPVVAGLLAAAVLVLRRRSPRVRSAGEVDDVPQRLLAALVAFLASDRAEWGQAMLGELDQITARGERWAFVLGCARVTVLLPPRRGAPGRGTVIVVATAAVACVGLVGYGLARYPGVITGARTWVAVAAFVAVVAGYPVATGVIVRGLDRPAFDAVRFALFGAALIAALWIVVGVAASFGMSDYFATLLLAALPVASLLVGALGTWRGNSGRTGRRAAALAAIGAGEVVFLAWVGETLLMAGRPYDPGMVRDFHTSGARDLATYAVNDNMGSAMVLLLLVPLLAGLIGVAGAAITTRFLERTAASD